MAPEAHQVYEVSSCSITSIGITDRRHSVLGVERSSPTNTIVGLTEPMTAGHSLRNVSPLHELILFQLFDSSVVWLLLF